MSELWQRLKAIRSFADLRQEDVGKICGVSRGAIAQWESKDPNNRTRPSVEQISKLATRAGVPVEWILNDAVDPSDVWRVGRLFQDERSTGDSLLITPSIASSSNSGGGSRVREAFGKAVEYEMLQRCPSLADGFGVALGHGMTKVHADFCCSRVVAQLVTTAEECMDSGNMGRLLLLERAAGRSMNKLLICGSRDVSEVSQAFTEQMLATFGIKVVLVASPEDAAEYLISACSTNSI